MLGTIAAFALLSGQGADPWPLERQDRYGTGRATVGGPNTYAPPWRYVEYGNGFITSHGPSFGGDGSGYFGKWVNNVMVRFDPALGVITDTVPAGDFVACTPAIGSDKIYFATDNPNTGKVIALNKSGLWIEWVNDTGYISGSPTLGPEGDVTYARKGVGTVYRVNKDTGATVWSSTGFSNPVGTVVFLRDDSAVVVAYGNKVAALDWATGATLWTYDAGSQTGSCGVAPDGSVVFGAMSGRVIALNANGTLKWQRFTTNQVDAAPTFDGVNTYIGSRDQAIYAFRMSDGLPLWNKLTNNWISIGGVVDNNGRIYIQNRIGYIHCLNADGTENWVRRVGEDARGPMTIAPNGWLYVGYAGSPNSGMVSIRQDAPVLNFGLVESNEGINVTGDNSALLSVDNVPMEFASETSGTLATAVVADFEAFVPKNQLDTLVMSTNVKTLGSYPLDFKAYAFNYQTNSWQSIPILVRLGTSPRTFNLQFGSPPSQAVEAGTGRIKVRLRFDRFSRPTSQWGVSVDQLTGHVNPTF